MAHKVLKEEFSAKTVTSKEYRLLFNTLSESIQDMEQIVERLKAAQIEAEELCLDETAPREAILFPQAGTLAAK